VFSTQLGSFKAGCRFDSKITQTKRFSATSLSFALLTCLALWNVNSATAETLLGVNFSSAFVNGTENIFRFDSSFSVEGGDELSAGVWDTTYDAVTGKLYGIGVRNVGGTTQDQVRIWNTDGSFTDVLLDYSAAFGATLNSAFSQISPDLAVHDGILAVNFRSDNTSGAERNIFRFDSSFSVEGGDELSAGVWDIAYDGEGNLYGIGVRDANGRNLDHVRIWNTNGSVVDTIPLDYTTAFGTELNSAFAQNSPDLAVFSPIVPEPHALGLLSIATGIFLTRRSRTEPT